MTDKKRPLTTKQRIFVDEYIKDYNATQAAIRAGYSAKTAALIGWENIRKPNIKELIDIHVESFAVGRNERLAILAELSREASRDSDRLTAVKMLGQLSGDYIEKKEVELSGGIDITSKVEAAINKAYK